jgi:hypothetical protein
MSLNFTNCSSLVTLFARLDGAALELFFLGRFKSGRDYPPYLYGMCHAARQTAARLSKEKQLCFDLLLQ